MRIPDEDRTWLRVGYWRKQGDSHIGIRDAHTHCWNYLCGKNAFRQDESAWEPHGDHQEPAAPHCQECLRRARVLGVLFSEEVSP